MFNIAPSSQLGNTEACSARKASSIAAHFGMHAGPVTRCTEGGLGCNEIKRIVSCGELVEMTPPVTESRRCGTCTLCCKVLTIPEFGNPSGQWCPHCVQGRGCTIYPNWPNECRAFQCGYLMWPELGEHWRPSRSKLVVAFKPDGMEIVFHVDP